MDEFQLIRVGEHIIVSVQISSIPLSLAPQTLFQGKILNILTQFLSLSKIADLTKSFLKQVQNNRMYESALM